MKKHNPIFYALIFIVVAVVSQEFIPGWEGTWLKTIHALEVIVAVLLAYIYGRESK